MKTELYTDLDFTDEFEYYQYIIDSFHNGQLTQMNRLYKDMNDIDKEYFLKESLPENTSISNATEIRNYLLLN